MRSSPEPDSAAFPVVVLIHGTGGGGAAFAQSLAPLVARLTQAGLDVRFPDFATPYQFPSPESESLGKAFGQRTILVGFSGGAQFAHRWAQLHPAAILGCVAYSAGSWTDPDGECHGMMVDEGWFGRPEWNLSQVAEARARRASPGFERVRWLVGCGRTDHPSRWSSAVRFSRRLVQAGARVRFHPYDGAHTPPSGDDLVVTGDEILSWLPATTPSAARTFATA
jgi:predicted esterase